jgi:predicted nucleic acid-binding Zn ribbon protein
MSECEHCGGRLEKQMAAPAFHLKGGGWYKDGYASQKQAGADSGSTSSDGADSSKKSAGASDDGGGKKSDGGGGKSSDSSGGKSSETPSKSKGSGSSDAA